VSFQEKCKHKLVETHSECSEIVKSFGFVPEPLETTLVVEEHRWFWKPKDVKFILVAESHVYTNKDEIKVKIDPSRLPKEAPKRVPLNFVRLVYCLGYGEPNILNAPRKIENNRGTRQYVNLFKRCVGLHEKPSSMTQLEWKVRILETIKGKGIWLLDASVHACYKGKGKRLPPKLVKKITTISWNKYVKPIIDDISIDRKRVWIIGKSLHDILGGEYTSSSNWIYQPNTRFKNPEKYAEKEHRELALIRTIKRYCLQKA